VRILSSRRGSGEQFEKGAARVVTVSPGCKFVHLPGTDCSRRAISNVVFGAILVWLVRMYGGNEATA
jgi:hypothetical protein